MNEPPGARARVALTGLTVAEYFRDQEGQDVLLFIDNIFRFTQAGSEVHNARYNFPLLADVINKIVLFMHIYFVFKYLCHFSSGFCPVGSYPLCCGLPAYPGH